jgi:hypothetical protein
MPRTRVILRRNGSKVGEVTYASESEAVAHAAKMQGAASGIEALLAPATPVANRKPRRNPSIGRGPRRNGAVGYEQGTAKDGTQIRLDWAFHPGGTIWTLTDHSQGVVMRTENADKAHDAFMQAFAAHGGRRNPSIGRGTKHRDAVAEAVTRRMRSQGVAKREAVSRGFAIATAAELRKNPTPIDIGSLDFGHFKKTVKIDSYYNVRTGRRFARVVSKDGTFVTDVPVADGGKGGSRAKGADAIKRRAYDQLRVHLQPTTWKPSVRVNPAGSVAYGGTTIRIAAGTYTVMPHGPAFSGPNGFVAAKKWIDSHGA